jgi:hypothetical protein
LALLTFHLKVLIEKLNYSREQGRETIRVELKHKEKLMEFYIPNFQLKEVSEALAREGVTFEITDQTLSLVIAGKESYEVTQAKADLLETEVPAIYDADEPRRLRAFRLPSGKKILLTDADGNFDRLVEPPPGWGR